MRVAFEQAAIHVRAGVAFVTVDHHVLGNAWRVARGLPLDARRETGAAAAAQVGLFDLLQAPLPGVISVSAFASAE